MKEGLEVRCPACDANIMSGPSEIEAIILDSGRVIKVGDPCRLDGSVVMKNVGPTPEGRAIHKIDRLYWGTIIPTNVFLLVNDANEVISTIPGGKVEQLICKGHKLPEHSKDCKDGEA